MFAGLISAKTAIAKNKIIEHKEKIIRTLSIFLLGFSLDTPLLKSAKRMKAMELIIIISMQTPNMT